MLMQVGVPKICIRLSCVPPKGPCDWKRYEIGPCLLWNVNRKSEMTAYTVSSGTLNSTIPYHTRDDGLIGVGSDDLE